MSVIQISSLPPTFEMISVSPNSNYFRDGEARQLRFSGPAGIAVNPEDGSIYISEYNGHRIRKIFILHWTKETHSQFPLSTKNRIVTIMEMSVQQGTQFNKLPRDVTFVIIQILSLIETIANGTLSAVKEGDK